MEKYRQSAIIGFISALFFSVLCFTGVFSSLDNRLYDFFLGQRPKRERTDLVVFLDVDNQAIAFNGVFPWPRSVMADGLLRLKEYGAHAVIFDIEYVDRGPQGVDNINLDGLPFDFYRTFSEINSSMGDLINSLHEGWIDRAEAMHFLAEYIGNEHSSLLDRALSVARDNDVYLTQAAALFGNSWATLNLRTNPLEGEQAGRRSMAEELFSYSVSAGGNAHISNDTFVDILPPIPSFAGAIRGAGFTRAYVDSDGVRRRIDLVQEFNNHWYLQLAFAPLVSYLGEPAIEVEGNSLILRGAVFPSESGKRDLRIPLDYNGRMLLDWPTASFENSFDHYSFAYLSLLEQARAEIERHVSILSASENLYNFISYDPSMTHIPVILYQIADLLTEAGNERNDALANTSEKSFSNYLALRGEAWNQLYRFREMDFSGGILDLGLDLASWFPDEAEQIIEECEYLSDITRNLFLNLDSFDSIQDMLKKAFSGKFCVIGQTDAMTTDIGVNPFNNEYVNVGTQGVVIDTILAGSFITWLSPWWSALFCILTPILILLFTNFSTGPRSVFGFMSAVLALFVSFFLFRFTGIFLEPLSLVFSIITAVVFREITAYVLSDREKQFISKAFSTYVSEDVVKEIIANPSKLQLGGTKRHMSAMFTDLKDFSAITERLDPEDLVRLLNRYLTAMSDVILKEKGTIDKYEGDAIIAFFGAPLELPDHAYRACLSAIAMKRIEVELSKTLMEQNQTPLPLLTRIGINTGSMVAGNMGTQNKMNYTIMGNTVNLAARLEGVNKLYGTWILTTMETLNETEGKFLTRKLDRVRVVGINEPVQLFELVETIDAATNEQKETVYLFEKGLSLYENREWKKAESAFRRTLAFNENDNPSRIFYRRSKTYMKNPPPEEWDSVFNLDKK